MVDWGFVWVNLATSIIGIVSLKKRLELVELQAAYHPLWFLLTL